MLKSLLVCVDDTPGTKAACGFAAALAQRAGARLAGMAVLDTAWIEHGEAAPLGGSTFLVNLEKKRRNWAAARAEAGAALFRAAGGTETFETVSGDPAEAIVAAAHGHDAVVIGADVRFREDENDDISEAVEGLVRRSPRPTILVPAAPLEGRGTLIAFDGSLPATRALHMCVLLGLAGEGPVTLLQAGEASAEMQAAMAAAQGLLVQHGITPQIKALPAHAHAAEAIAIEADALRPRLLVLGAYGHRRLRDVVFGSTTERLLAAPPAPLFLFH
jgi:nucleotide-binding universal stress UspA family protein